MIFPNFNDWYEVPLEATIPEGTPLLCIREDESDAIYHENGYLVDFMPCDNENFTFWTEKKFWEPDPMDEENKSDRRLTFSPTYTFRLVWVKDEGWVSLVAGVPTYPTLKEALEGWPQRKLTFDNKET